MSYFLTYYLYFNFIYLFYVLIFIIDDDLDFIVHV